jgi:hypothetical protein
VIEQDRRGVCEECGRAFVLSAAELRHRATAPGQPVRLCHRCLIAAAHERRLSAATLESTPPR